MMRMRLIGTEEEIAMWIDIFTKQRKFYVKASEPVILKDYIDHTKKMAGRTDVYQPKECEDPDIKVVFIKGFQTQEELLKDCDKEKKYRKKQEEKNVFKTIRTSTGISYGGRRARTEEDKDHED